MSHDVTFMVSLRGHVPGVMFPFLKKTPSSAVSLGFQFSCLSKGIQQCPQKAGSNTVSMGGLHPSGLAGSGCPSMHQMALATSVQVSELALVFPLNI